MPSDVYVLFPTSNHNVDQNPTYQLLMYMSYFLLQTTTCWQYVKNSCLMYMSYFLLQTTTVSGGVKPAAGCICLISYFKPQLAPHASLLRRDVYVLFPTSNHNS